VSVVVVVIEMCIHFIKS